MLVSNTGNLVPRGQWTPHLKNDSSTTGFGAFFYELSIFTMKQFTPLSVGPSSSFLLDPALPSKSQLSLSRKVEIDISLALGYLQVSL